VPVLSIRDLSARYGGVVHALSGVDLDVDDGQVVAVLGSNGAGKSSLLRAISGTLPLHRGEITSGDVEYDSKRLNGRDPAAIVRMGVVQVPEGRRIFGRLTVEENLRAGGMGNPDRKARTGGRDRVYQLFPRLAERRGRRAALLSGGEQQMLAIGRALMASPRLLLLDEPSLGLAPRVVARIGEVVREINAQGVAVVLVEQNAALALALASYAYVLDVGQLSLAGPAEQLRATDEVRRLYLGQGGEAEHEALEHLREVAAATPRLRRWEG
jgi:branched-chain amino acid transport system ATP-binding protein